MQFLDILYCFNEMVYCLIYICIYSSILNCKKYAFKLNILLFEKYEQLSFHIDISHVEL